MVYQKIDDWKAHFWNGVDQSGGPEACWHWQRGLGRTMYGTFRSHSVGKRYAHVVAYLLSQGDVPNGMTIDHTCHNNDLSCAGGIGCLHRRCCNPRHLEAVSMKTNKARADNARGKGRKDECVNGHPRTQGNSYYIGPKLVCRLCNRAAVARYRARRDANSAPIEDGCQVS